MANVSLDLHNKCFFWQGFLRMFCKICHIWRENYQKLPHLDIAFMEITKQSKNLKNKIFSYLTFSWIWLIPLVDVCQSTYLTKLRKKITMFKIWRLHVHNLFMSTCGTTTILWTKNLISIDWHYMLAQTRQFHFPIF